MLPRLNKIDIFDDFFKEPFHGTNKELMQTDIKETEDKYVLEITLPGCEKKDIQIELKNGYITVEATMNETIDENNEKENYIHKERFYGQMKRSYYAGENVTEEDIKATFKNGILSVSFPKEQAEENTKKYIEISE